MVTRLQQQHVYAVCGGMQGYVTHSLECQECDDRVPVATLCNIHQTKDTALQYHHGTGTTIQQILGVIQNQDKFRKSVSFNFLLIYTSPFLQFWGSTQIEKNISQIILCPSSLRFVIFVRPSLKLLPNTIFLETGLWKYS